MDNEGEFVAWYIQDSVFEGVCKPADIRARAVEDVQKIDERIKKIEELKAQKARLYAVIKHLGGGSKAPAFNETVDFSVSEDKLNPFFKDIMYYICDSLENSRQSDSWGIANDQILSQFGVENNKTIYSAIKWLGSRDIIVRDEDSYLQKGPKWEDRLCR